MKCWKCDDVGTQRVEASTQGIYCNTCDLWLVVTSFIEPILQDQTEYVVSISGGEGNPTVEQIRGVATVAGVNFLAARALLTAENTTQIFTGCALDTRRVTEQLCLTGVAYTVSPDFPYLPNSSGG